MSLRSITTVVALSLLLLGCGGGADRTKAQLRLVNASVDYAALDLRVDGSVRQGSVAFGETAGYVEVDPGKETTLTLANSPTALVSFTPSLSKNRRYTTLAYGAQGALRQLLIDDNVGEPDNGRALLRIVNAAPDAGSLDVYLTAAGDALSSAVPLRSGAELGSPGDPITVNSATWRLRVTAAGKKTDLWLDISGLVLDSRQVATLVLTPGRGGVLLNALLVGQGGTLQRLDTTQARVRVAAGVTDSGAVSATVGGVPLMVSVGSPAVGLYTVLPAGTQPVTLAVNGIPLAAGGVTLTAGADHTLLVRGTASAPLASWIVDDNRKAADIGHARLRLVNGIATLAAPLSMTVDFVPAADGVAAGAASTYLSLAAKSDAKLSVTAAGQATPLFTAVDEKLEAGAVYSVFVVGSPNAPVGIVRKDR